MTTNLTQKHFIWLALEIAPLLQAGKGIQFMELIRDFSNNPKFNRQLFMSTAEGAWLDANNISLQPEAQLDDHVPFLGEKNAINTATA